MDTTNISDLPNTPLNDGNNITMMQSDKDSIQQIPQQMHQPMPQQMHQQETQQNETANIDTVLQRARETGSLSLPSRDIPVDTTQITHDNEALPDFIPNNKNDYIEEMMTIEELQEKRRKERNKDDSLEEVYRELQVPIFIGILFFIFQLPITNNYFHKFFTFGFRSDGQMNLQGYLVKSFCFASLYYILNLLMNRLSDI